MGTSGRSPATPVPRPARVDVGRTDHAHGRGLLLPGGTEMAWDAGDFCQTSADEFVAGDLEAMAARYAFPLGVYLPDSLQVHVTREDFVSALRRRRALALDRGTARIRATVLVIDAMKDGRLPLMVEWSFRDAEDRQIARNRMRHYCRRGPAGGLLVEMVEILRLGFPEAPL